MQNLPKKTGLNYTADTFFTEAINDINSTQLPTRSKRGTYNNYNGTKEGWNYKRYFYDSERSKRTAKTLADASSNFAYYGGGIAAALTGAGGPVGAAMGAAIGGTSAFTAWYAGTLSRAISANNTGAGVAIDINKYTQVFSVYDQRKL